MFQDAVDDLEVKLEKHAVVARDAYEKAGKTFVDATTRVEFDGVVGDRLEEEVKADIYTFVSRPRSLSQ